MGMRAELRTTCSGKRGARRKGGAGQFSTSGKKEVKAESLKLKAKIEDLTRSAQRTDAQRAQKAGKERGAHARRTVVDIKGAARLPGRSRGKLQAGPTNEKNRAN